jgi:hypothetical protein
MRRSGQFIGGVCALGAALLPGEVRAQDSDLLVYFGIENRLELSHNESLSVPAAGTEVSNVTLLSFGLNSETALDRINFEVVGGVIAQSRDGESEIEFGRGSLTFAYAREVPSAILELSALFRTDDADAFGDDIGDVGMVGTRSDLSLSARMETGRTSSVGFAFGLAYDETDFQDTLDPDLIDNREWRGDFAAVLHFSEITTGRLGVRYRHREEDDVGTETVDATTVFAGLDTSLSQRADLSLEVGVTETETEEGGVITEDRGPEGRIRLSYDMPVGIAYGLLRVTNEADEGQRDTFEIGRELEYQRDTITTRLGVTRNDETGTDLIGALEWTRALPDGSVGLVVERSVTYDVDDDIPVTESNFSLIWVKNVSDTTSLLFDATYEDRDSPTESIQQLSLDAGLNHMLTEDWSLAGGVGYTVRRDSAGRANSPSVFVSISRNFALR